MHRYSESMRNSPIHAVIFDLDGLLVDSEPYWERARHVFCRAEGCDWTEEDEVTVKGLNSSEWAAVISSRCGLTVGEAEIIQGVVREMHALYAEHLPLLPGALEVVNDLYPVYPLAVASSSPRELIEWVLCEAGVRPLFSVLVSADEVGRGKPRPDVFLAAARGLNRPPYQCAVFEDSTAGIRAGRAADMYVVAVPNDHFPPSAEALEMADLVVTSLRHFEPRMLE